MVKIMCGVMGARASNICYKRGGKTFEIDFCSL